MTAAWLTMLLGCAGGDPLPTVPPTTADELIASPYTSYNDPVGSAVRGGLLGDGVREGWIEWLRQEDCASILREVGTCHGAHPQSPYGMYQFPEDDDGLDNIATFQLDQDEVLLWVGRTPPDGRYFSWNHHQYEQAMPDGPPLVTFATSAPALHHLAVITEDSPTAPFDAFTIVAHTANREAGERVRALLTPVLAENGLSPDVVNLVPIAYAKAADHGGLVASGQVDAADVFELHPGYGPEADTQTTLMRVAAPGDVRDPYLTTGTVRTAVFKVKLDDPPSYAPPAWPRMPPDDQTDERQGPALRAAQLAVVAAVEDHLVDPALQTLRVDTTNEPQKSGADCINLRDKCGGNNDDARYLRTVLRMGLPDLDDPQAAVFVVGVNHTELRDRNPNAPKVTYSSLTVNNFSRGMGIVSLLDEQLKGSLRYWFTEEQLPGLTDDQWESLYVAQVSRNCALQADPDNPYCMQVNNDVVGLCPGDRFWLVERVYLNQTTATAPHELGVWEAILVAAGTQIEWVDRGPTLGALLLSPLPPPAPTPEWCRVGE